jgi:hypothetical protein
MTSDALIQRMSESFPYETRRFNMNLLLLIVAFLGFGTPVLLIVTPGALALISFIVVAGTTVMVLGASPTLTSHSIEDDVLVLRQGWYFKARIPLEDIKKVGRIEKGPKKIGVFFQPFSGAVHVTSRSEGLVSLKLNGMRRFALVLGKKADRVVFDVIDTDRLVERLTPSNRDRSS